MLRLVYWIRCPLRGIENQLYRRGFLSVILMCFCYIFIIQNSWKGLFDSTQKNGETTNEPAYFHFSSENETDSSLITVRDLVFDIQVDRQKSPTDDVLASSIQQRYSNLPYEFWLKERNKIHYQNKTCAFYPHLYDIKFSNEYWQMLYSSNGTFYLYGAYYDNRAALKRPSIRILGMIDRIQPSIKTHCLLWYDVDKDPLVVPVLQYENIWIKEWGNFKDGALQPYLMTCQLPEADDLKAKGFRKDQVPVSVSLTEKGCEPVFNNLVVHNKLPSNRKGRFAVCVKALDFLQEDLSIHLVEWIELLGLLGADKIFFYEFEVHPNISKVLRYYQEKGKVEITPITLPGDQPNIPGLRNMHLRSYVTSKYQNEVIPYNDCLYRNLYTYDYIALIDIDEVILPKTVSTWNELMDVIGANNSQHASYHFRHVYFWQNSEANRSLDHRETLDIPLHMNMLKTVYRSRNYTKPGEYIKCFHKVDKVLTLHNHFPRACLDGYCSSYSVEPEMAHLQHYRDDCVGELKDICGTVYKHNPIKDTTIWNYKDDLIQRVTRVLKLLGYFRASRQTSSFKLAFSKESNETDSK